MDLIKAGRIVESSDLVATIRSRLAAEKYNDKGFFHRLVTSVDEMKTYFKSLEQVVANPIIWQTEAWYNFPARKEHQEVLQRAEGMLEKFTQQELVFFSEHARSIGLFSESDYRTAVEHLFRQYKTSTEPEGRWTLTTLRRDFKLNIFQEIMELNRKYVVLSKKYTP